MVLAVPVYHSPLAGCLQAPISYSGVGDNIIIPGLAGKQILVLQFFLVVSTVTTLTYKSGSTAISGAIPFTANGSHVLDHIRIPLACNQGDGFVINSTAGAGAGTIWFLQQ